MLSLTIAVLASLSSCREEEPTGEIHSKQFFDYFDTFGTVSDYSGGSRESFDSRMAGAMALIEEYHRLYDIYNEYTGLANLATLNRMAGKGPIRVDIKIIELLEYSKEMYRLTGGEVNVAFGAVLRIWHDCRTEKTGVPTREELSSANEHCDINDVIIDREAMTVELADPEMSLDVGAVAKGYTVERLAEYFDGLNVSSQVIDIGGNLRVVGTKPNGNGWSAAAQNPYTGEYLKIIELRDSAFVTSGSHQRFYEYEGVRYHHIIDKDTLMPENRYVQVSVNAPSSAMADALSTALFNMERLEAEALIQSLEGVTAIFLCPDGEVFELSSR